MYTIEMAQAETVIENMAAGIFKQYIAAQELGLLVCTKPLPSLCDVKVVWKGVRYAGRYYPVHCTIDRYTVQTVEINAAYFMHKHDNNELRETIAHELAHYIQDACYRPFKQWHGVEFRHIMNSIGYSGDTYHKMSVAAARSVAKKVKSNDDVLVDLS